MIKEIDTFLANAWIKVVLVFLTVLHLSYFFYVNREFYGDKAIQINGAKNLVAGNGITNLRVQESNGQFSLAHYTITNWPPGYSLILAPVLLLTSNIAVADSVLNIIFLVGLGVGIFLIFSSLNLSLPHLSFVAFISFLNLSYIPVYALKSAGLYAFCSLVFALGLLAKGKANKKIIALASLVLLVAFSLRYAYIIYLPIPLLFFLYHRSWKLKASLPEVLKFSIIPIVGLLLLFVIVKTGNTISYYGEAQSGAGFYPEHLLKTLDFMSQSFIFGGTNFIENRFFGKENFILSSVLNALLFLCFVFILVRNVYIPKGNKYEFIWLYIILVTPLFLIFLSLISPGIENGKGDYFTYVQELRYYAPLQFAAIITLVIFLNSKVKIKGRAGLIALVFSVFISCYAAYGFFNQFNYNYSSQTGKYTSELVLNNPEKILELEYCLIVPETAELKKSMSSIGVYKSAICSKRELKILPTIISSNFDFDIVYISEQNNELVLERTPANVK